MRERYPDAVFVVTYVVLKNDNTFGIEFEQLYGKNEPPAQANPIHTFWIYYGDGHHGYDSCVDDAKASFRSHIEVVLTKKNNPEACYNRWYWWAFKVLKAHYVIDHFLPHYYQTIKDTSPALPATAPSTNADNVIAFAPLDSLGVKQPITPCKPQVRPSNCNAVRVNIE